VLTYEYGCKKCGVFEVRQSIKDPALKKCPRCGSQNIARLISGGTGFIMDPDNLWDTPVAGKPEVKIDLHKSEAYLLGVPKAKREKYRRVHYGRTDPKTGAEKTSTLRGKEIRSAR
jgi:putative FmdB family regulatory protein